jgi:hypothetical protein
MRREAEERSGAATREHDVARLRVGARRAQTSHPLQGICRRPGQLYTFV